MSDVQVKNSLGQTITVDSTDSGFISGNLRPASIEELRVEAAQAADQAAFNADPAAYTKRLSEEVAAAAEARFQEKERAANEAMGGPFQKALLGAATGAALGPLGLSAMGASTAGSALQGRLPSQETFTRANMGMMNTLPGVGAAMGGMFGKENMLAIQEGSGFTSGKVAGMLGAGFGGPASLLGRGASLARIAALEGLEGAIMNANDEATQSYLNNEPLSASKILMAAGTGAAISALPVVGIAGGKAVGRYFRNAGALNEAKLGISGIDAEVRQAYRAKGLDYDDFAKRAGLPNVTRAEDLPSVAAKLTDDAADLGKRISSLEGKIPKTAAPVTVMEAAEDYANVASVAFPAFKMPANGQTFAKVAAAAAEAEKAAVRAVYSGKFVPDPDNIGRTVLGRSEAGIAAGKRAMEEVKWNGKSLLGGAKMLDKIQEVGGVTGQNIGELRKYASTLDAHMEVGAQRVLNSAQRKIAGKVLELDPVLSKQLKELTERKAATDFAASRYRDAAAKATESGSIKEAFKEPFKRVSNFNIAMGIVGALNGWHSSIGYIIGKMGLGTLKDLPAKLAPTIAAGNRVANLVERSTVAIANAGKTAARVAATNANVRSKPIETPTREQMATTLRGLKALKNAPNQKTALTAVSKDLDAQVVSKAQQVASNVEAKFAELAPLAYQQAMTADEKMLAEYGAIGSLVKSQAPGKKPGIGETMAYQYAMAAMNPMVTLKSIEDLTFNNIQIEAMRDNYPEILDEVANQMTLTIMDEGLSGDVSLDNRARIAKIVGMPIDLSTSPEFFHEIQKLFVQPEDQQAPSPGPGNQRIPTNFATESEKLESK